MPAPQPLYIDSLSWARIAAETSTNMAMSNNNVRFIVNYLFFSFITDIMT
jgi:hypothetical protein